MKHRGFLYLAAFVALILAVGLACAGSAAPTATAIPPASAPTLPPAPANTPQPSGPFQLDTTRYTHRSGAFSFYPPKGWKLDESDVNAFYSPADQKGAVEVNVTNTGYTLDEQSFENFVRNSEDNFFAGRDQYIEQNFKADAATKTITVKKTFLFSNVTQVVVSVYHQEGQAIYAAHFWADKDVADAYHAIYEDILNGLTLNSKPVVNMSAYAFTYTFTGPNSLFTIDVPTAWSYSSDTSVQYFVIDTFLSPDGHAAIQNIMYDDGTKVAGKDLAQFALNILNQNYSSGGGVKVSEEKQQPDGSDRLTWTTRQGGLSGITFIELRGTAALMFSVLYDDPYTDAYLPVLNTTIGSYNVP